MAWQWVQERGAVASVCVWRDTQQWCSAGCPGAPRCAVRGCWHAAQARRRCSLWVAGWSMPPPHVRATVHLETDAGWLGLQPEQAMRGLLQRLVVVEQTAPLHTGHPAQTTCPLKAPFQGPHSRHPPSILADNQQLCSTFAVPAAWCAAHQEHFVYLFQHHTRSTTAQHSAASGPMHGRGALHN
jgi:hypothetical protein